MALVGTTGGDIVITLFGDKAPRTVRRFTEIATGTVPNSSRVAASDGTRRLYNGVRLYRVAAGFVTHTGLPAAAADFLAPPVGPPDRPGRGFDAPFLVGLARTEEFCRFFITTRPTPWMNGQHALLGELLDEPSRKVVESIGSLRPGDREPVTIVDVRTGEAR
ncbi:peptidylprolyl isomerase [Pseudonocardia acaciae]|uniref:peptidylprolyl isomerase n=1 Tax=Pseudonocardia acaciae TaxID=551276 RepID=UPI00048FC6A0|nr:peptidylprolyl isomerase [Pseudonocardia acaciae]